MLHCLHSLEDFVGNSTGMSVLERQRATLEWLLKFQQQQPLLENHVTTLNNSIDNMMMAEQYNYLPDFANFSIAGKESGFVSPESRTSSLEVERSRSMTSGHVPAVLESAKMKEKVVELKDRDVSIGKGRLNKRNAESVVADECKAKRIKGEEAEEEESHKVSEKSCREASSDSSKDNNSNSKAIEVQKPDFIHVRARRGQATDSHSLAERARREKINKKMKYLQDLVPGCSKIVGKAGMLDEIINYVQSLQGQVEFLSMKLAAINPKMEFNIENLFGKEPLHRRKRPPVCPTLINKEPQAVN